MSLESALVLEVQEKTYTDKGFGDSGFDEWTTQRREWFTIKSTGGREYEQEQQIRSEITHKARCHYFGGANSKMRLKKDNRIWHVESVVNEDEANRWLIWMLKQDG